MCNSTIQKYGANPISVKWNVVRGDTAELFVDFFELDETTGFDCSDWTYKATAYDVNGDVRINVADENYINLRRYSLFGGWVNMAPARLYTPAQYTTLITNTTDLRISIPGVSSITINSPVSGGSQNYYLIAPGYKSTVNY